MVPLGLVVAFYAVYYRLFAFFLACVAALDEHWESKCALAVPFVLESQLNS